MHKNEDSPFFKGVYAPVHNEQLSRRLTVEGCIPDALDGVYMRTGPNPQHEPHGGYTMCAPNVCIACPQSAPTRH